MTATDRLAELAKQIREKQSHLINDERAAFDLFDERAYERATLTRGVLEALLISYFEESERRRAESARAA